jgi:hypothetical protein
MTVVRVPRLAAAAVTAAAMTVAANAPVVHRVVRPATTTATTVAAMTADAVAIENWLDPVSWKIPTGWLGTRRMPFSPEPKDDPEHAGCLMFASMSIRNFYGMWHADNPHTEAEFVEVTDGVVTDPRHPDNFSGRVFDRVKKALADMVVPA